METMQPVGVIRLKGKYGGCAIVDADRVTELSVRRWRQDKNGYIKTSTYIGKKNGALYLHRVVVGAAKDQHVDHANRDKLDNRACSLRPSTRSQNLGNAKKRSGDRISSQYKGVSRDKKVWAARIQCRRLGSFPTEVEAAYAYNVAALKVFGEFARVNAIP